MRVYIEAGREGYTPDQVGELIRALEEFDEGTRAYLKHDGGYTYGGIRRDSITEEECEDDEERNQEEKAWVRVHAQADPRGWFSNRAGHHRGNTGMGAVPFLLPASELGNLHPGGPERRTQIKFHCAYGPARGGTH